MTEKQMSTQLYGLSDALRSLSERYMGTYGGVMDGPTKAFCSDILSFLPESADSVSTARSNILGALYGVARSQPMSNGESSALEPLPVALGVGGSTNPPTATGAEVEANELPAEPFSLDSLVTRNRLVAPSSLRITPAPSADASTTPASGTVAMDAKTYLEIAKEKCDEMVRQHKLAKASKSKQASGLAVRSAKSIQTPRSIAMERPSMSLSRKLRLSNSTDPSSSGNDLTSGSVLGKGLSSFINALASSSKKAPEASLSVSVTPLASPASILPAAQSNTALTTPPRIPRPAQLVLNPSTSRSIGGLDVLLMPPPLCVPSSKRKPDSEQALSNATSSGVAEDPSIDDAMTESGEPAGPSRGRRLRRENGFYEKSHPDIFWTSEWGTIPPEEVDPEIQEVPPPDAVESTYEASLLTDLHVIPLEDTLGDLEYRRLKNQMDLEGLKRKKRRALDREEPQRLAALAAKHTRRAEKAKVRAIKSRLRLQGDAAARLDSAILTAPSVQHPTIAGNALSDGVPDALQSDSSSRLQNMVRSITNVVTGKRKSSSDDTTDLLPAAHLEGGGPSTRPINRKRSMEDVEMDGPQLRTTKKLRRTGSKEE
ncbi:hypothetical protein HGRIS_010994 [Hohenbuehelia grisea]|uniref:Uncharacterized protein n=1 Tax=Hohenbuehelia grisea TaxID=104357 RepID=A0ABR3IYR5_9AGAR